ncbi:MAG: LptF/LptG family permease [Alphaproteobacteria bacterium]
MTGKGAATGLITFYLVRETSRPLLFSLMITLAALLLERTLRLLELLTSHGGPLELVFQLTMNLLPHYLGLALPATFFISLFVVISRFDSNNEFVTISGAGLSLYRIVRPLVMIGVGFAFISIALFGYIQPYSRYLYREIIHVVTTTAWNATLSERVFAKLGDGLTIYADEVDATGRHLAGIFIREARDGTEILTTAQSGALLVDGSHTRLQLVLREGARTTIRKNAETLTVSFTSVTFGRDFAFDAAPFRARGKDGRELTLNEIWRLMDETPPGAAHAGLSAEFHTRLARAASLPLLPLLAMAMGMASQRASRATGIAAGGLILVLYHHMIQLGGSLVERGMFSPLMAIWLPFALFAGFCILTFHRTDASPGGNPFDSIFAGIEGLVSGLAGALRPESKNPA